MITVLIHFTGKEAKIKAASENEDSKVKFTYFKETRMNNVYQLFIKLLLPLRLISVEAQVPLPDNRWSISI